jgi:phasin family protein
LSPKFEALGARQGRREMLDPLLSAPYTMSEIKRLWREPSTWYVRGKSVDQAERAISSFLESASKSVAMVPSPMNDVGQQALAITEKNLKASFEHARKLMNAKDINEVMQLQTEFLRNQFGVATEQSKQMSGGIASAGGDVAKEEHDLI